MNKEKQQSAISVENLTLGYGDRVICKDINFSVDKGQVLAVIGGSGCGKSTLMRCMTGLLEAKEGTVYYEGESFTDAEQREEFLRRFGVLYQGSALWSSMTLAENVALPLQLYTKLKKRQIRDVVSYKLALVGLRGYEEYYPAEISGGMKKRAGLARAIALDPQYLFFDEPSAGLDPLSSHRLDELIVQCKEALGATVVLVTHELDSIFAVADTAIFLDTESKSMLAQGDPGTWLKEPPNEVIQRFLTRDGNRTER